MMPNKIIWLAMLLTLVYWLGNAGGCATQGDNQNYELLEEDRPMFDPRHDTDKPGASLTPAPGSPGTPGTPEAAPSLQGLDRSHWVTIETRPAVAALPYQPHYFSDVPLDATPRRDSPLDGAAMVAWDPINTQATLVEPIKVGVDLVLLPIRMVQDPPRFGEVRFVSGWRDTAAATDDAQADEVTTDEPVPADAGS
jgi:hypothetical protein